MMNINKLRASGMRHVMEIKGAFEGNPHHQEHIRDFCNYADAVSQGEADEVR